MPEVMKAFSPFTTYVVPVAPRGGAQLGNVRAAARLGDGERTDLLAGEDVRQHACLEGLAADAGDRRRTDAVGEQARMQAARTGACDFLGQDDVMEKVGLDAAVGLRKADGEQPGVGRFSVQRARELTGLVPGCRVRYKLALDEAAYAVAKLLVLGGERGMGAAHAASNSNSNWPGATCVHRSPRGPR